MKLERNCGKKKFGVIQTVFVIYVIYDECYILPGLLW